MDRFVYKEENKREIKSASPAVGVLLNNVFSKIILLIISIFLLYNVGHSIKITAQKLDILQRARVEVDNLRLKNLELALLLDKMQSTEYLEVQARNRLNFTGENEYVFVIPPKVLEDVEGTMLTFLYGDQEKREVGVYEVWGEFLIGGI